MSETSEGSSNSIGVEKQKTLRFLIIIAALVLLALVGFLVLLKGIEKGGGGKVDVDLTGGKFSLSLQKPIVDQIGLGTSKVEGTGNEIAFTEGKITNQDVVNQIKNLGQSTPTSFSGRNFISKALRFLFSVKHPEKWQVKYNPAGIQNSDFPIYTIFNQDGSHLNIGIEQIPPGINIQQYVATAIQNMFRAGTILQMPQVNYDLPSETAFLVYTNPQTMGQSYQKVIINRAQNRVYAASANYNQTLSDPQGVQDLLNMIATFTLF